MKTSELQYGLHDRPSLAVTLGSAFQHVMLGLVTLSFPLLVIEDIYPRSMLPPDQVSTLMITSFLALGVATLLQACRFGGIGSGFLAPAVFTAADLPPSLAAAHAGGLGLVFGMTIFAGLLEIGLAFLIRRYPKMFPAELAGFVVMFIGLVLGEVSIRLIFGLSAAGIADMNTTSIPVLALLTCLVTIIASIWFKGAIRSFSVLIGLGVAVMVGLTTDSLSLASLDHPALKGSFSWPIAMPTFDPTFILPFAAAALATSLRSMADIITCQRINDGNWKRPEQTSIHRGVLADGLGDVFAGLIGTVGLNTYSGSVGLSAATGITSRRVALAIGAMWITLACIPGIPQIVAIVPRSILGGALLFTSCFIVFNGVQIIADRVLDNRKIIALGLGLFAGITRMVYPKLFEGIHPAFSSLVQSELTLATLIVLGLTAVFRLGLNRNRSIAIPMDENRFEAVSQFLHVAAAAWGTRQQPLSRAVAASIEFLELAPDLVTPGTPIELSLFGDDTELKVRISYRGKVLKQGDDSRLELDDLDGDAAQRARFAQALLSRLCGEIQAFEDRGICVLQLVFEQ